MNKQIITIQDETAQVDVTLWNDDINEDLNIKDSMMISKAKIVRWAGKTSLTVRGYMVINSAAHKIKKNKINVNDESTTNISDESEIDVNFDWTKLELSTIGEMQDKVRFADLEQKLDFKLMAHIQQIYGQKMWYDDKETGEKKWRLQMKFVDEQKAEVKVTAFETSQTFLEMSANDAYNLQKKDWKKFCKHLETIIEADEKFCLHVQVSKNNYDGQPRFIVVNAKKT